MSAPFDCDEIAARCAASSLPPFIDFDDEPQLLRRLIDDQLPLREALRLLPLIRAELRFRGDHALDQLERAA